MGMSKSCPDSAIFMEDTAKDVRRKIKGAFCPMGKAENNPVLEYVKLFCFPRNGKFELIRKEENGGPKTYTEYADVVEDFVSGALHPGDLKTSLAAAINEMIAPVREHFQKDKRAKGLLKLVTKYRVT